LTTCKHWDCKKGPASGPGSLLERTLYSTNNGEFTIGRGKNPRAAALVTAVIAIASIAPVIPAPVAAPIIAVVIARPDADTYAARPCAEIHTLRESGCSQSDTGAASTPNARILIAISECFCL
jgi:hypothetical protein